MSSIKQNPGLTPRITGIALGLGIGLSAQTALAQGLALEEIVVTAQKRTESIQETPISIVAFDSMALEAKGISSLVDLQANVPNFQLTPTPTSSTDVRVFMRGVGNNDDQITQDPSVAVYMDGVYMARSQGMAMDVADIERIEVLRGPQGSLYGRNATGGAINFVTRAPELGQFGFRQSLSVGSRSLARSSTRLNLPLGDDVAIRLAYMTQQQDGFVRNRGTGERRFGDRDRDAWRVDALWRVNADLDIRYSYDRSDIADTPSFIARVPAYPQQGDRPSSGSPLETDLRANDVRIEGHGLDLSWEVAPNITLRSITSYRELQGLTNRKYLTDEIVPGAAISESRNDTEQDQFTQEFQITGDAFDARLEYVAGVYYFRESADRLDISNRRFMDLENVRVISADNKAVAVFGQGTWTPDVLEDRLHITLGGRWSRDRREASLQETADDDGDITVGPQGNGRNSFSNFSPTLVVAYDLGADTNVYGKVTRGYKSGGFNIRASSIERFEEGFDEEQLTSYELGVKSQLWNNRLRLNAAVFRSNYEDIQINTQSDPVNPQITDVINAGKAVIRGLELEATARLTEGLTANLNYAYLNADYRSIRGADGVDRSSDFRFANAPRHSYAADLEYRFPALPLGQLTANVGYTWQDDKRDSSTSPHIIKSYGLLNARLGLSDIAMGGGELRLALWGRNLTDKEYYATFFELGVPAAVFGEPRSYGLDLTWEY